MNTILLISLTIVALCMVAFVIMKHQQSSEVATPANSHFLTDNQRIDLAQQAQNGNADAAYQLAFNRPRIPIIQQQNETIKRTTNAKPPPFR